MKILIKTLQGNLAEYELPDLATVHDLKQVIAENIKVPPTGQKLLHAGRVLSTESKLLVQCGMQARDEVMLMLPKQHLPNLQRLLPPPPPPPEADVQSESKAPSPSKSRVQAKFASSRRAVEEVAVSGEEYERAVEIMVNMGFTRAKVEGAMKAAFNNPNRATEYLVNGIPEDIAQLQRFQEDPDMLESQPQLQPPAFGMPPGRGFPLFGRPSVPAPRPRAAADPAEEYKVVTDYLASMGIPRGQPSAPPPPVPRLRLPGASGAPRVPGAPRPSLAHHLAAGAQPAEHVPGITAKDQEVIARLQTLGFERETATEIYFACEKDEKTAADYLMDNAESLHREEREADEEAQRELSGNPSQLFGGHPPFPGAPRHPLFRPAPRPNPNPNARAFYWQ